MSYIVTARKWRPQIFDDVVGQENITTTLKNSIAQNKIAHAYILTGTRGIGKTTTARIFAKAINCSNIENGNPCNKCRECVEINENKSLNVFEIDGASNNSVNDIREIKESVRYAPSSGKYKIYIIDEVHMLSISAFNALLKTLEEPPTHLVFIFATTEIHKIPATILSRCQRFDFRKNTIDEIVSRLEFISKAENIPIEKDALYLIAKKSDGSMRDSQVIFDQMIAISNGNITSEIVKKSLGIIELDFFFQLTDCIINKDIKSALTQLNTAIISGYNINILSQGLVEHFRNLLITSTINSTELVETTNEYKEKYLELIKKFSENDIVRYLKIATEIDNSLKFSSLPRFRFELGIAQLIKMETSISIESILQKIEDIKKNSDLISSNIETQEKIFNIESDKKKESNNISDFLIKELKAVEIEK